MKHFRMKAACLLAAVAMTASLLTGCGSKEPVSTVDFEAAAAQRDYIVQDGTDYFKDYDYIKLVTLAAPKNKAFQIEFYELNDEATAKSFYDSNKNNFVMMKGEDSIDKNDSGDNFDLYQLEMYGKFMMIERVQNTVVYIPSTDSTNKSTILAFLSEIKY